MHRALLLAIIVMAIPQAHAGKLSCWNAFASRNADAAILEIDFSTYTEFTQIHFDLGNDFFADYQQNKIGDAGPNWQNRSTKTISELANPTQVVQGSATSGRSPYKGMNEFRFVLGAYSFTSPYLNTNGEYEARLIMPSDLSNEVLATTRLPRGGNRANAVMILPRAFGASESGDTSLRLECR